MSFSFKNNKRIVQLFLILFCISILLPGLPVFFKGINSEVNAGEDDYTVSDAVYKTVSYYVYNKNTLDSWEEVFALNKLGKINEEDWDLSKWESDLGLDLTYAADYATLILSLISIGKNPEDVNGQNLIEKLVDRQSSDGSFGDQINETYWSIFALEKAGADYNKNKAIQHLISQQNTDGGFSYSYKGAPSGADTTGAVLLALSPYRDQDGVSECVESAINYLHNIQMDNGAFSYDGVATAESTVYAIIGLVANGEDIADNKWQKEDRTMIDALMDFQLGDGSFSHNKGGSSDPMATCQALLALSYLVDNYADYVVTNDENAFEDPDIKPEIRVRVEGRTSTLFDDVIEVVDETTGLELLKKAIGEKNIGLAETEFGIYIVSLFAETPEGMNDYWSIYTKTNNELTSASVGIADLHLGGIDELLLHFYSWGITKDPKITIEKSGLKTIITVKTYDTEEVVEGATVTIGSESYITDENGQISLQLPAGTYTARVEKQGELYPELIRTEVDFTVEKVEVRVRIEGRTSTLFDEVIELTNETTGIELLRTAIGEENIVGDETENIYITELLGEEANFDSERTYWGIYTIKDNELMTAPVGIATLSIAEIDELLLHFKNADVTKETKVSIEKDGLKTIITVKKISETWVQDLNNPEEWSCTITEEVVEGAKITIGSENYITNENGQVSVQLPAGTYTARVEKQGELYPELIRTEISFRVEEIGGPGGGDPKPTGISIKMAVVGKDGELLFGPSTVTLPTNSTVVDALDASGLDYNIRSDGYVSEIEGQREREEGSQSGWKYKVNNIVSDSNARDYKLKDGDRLIWWYAIKTNENGPSWSDIETARPGEPIKNIEKITEKTGDELIEEQIAKEEKVVISLEERAEPSITFSKATLDKLAESSKPLVIKNAGAEIYFEPETLLTKEITEALANNNSEIKIEVKEVDGNQAEKLFEEIADHKNGKIVNVAGKLFEFSFKILEKNEDDSIVEQDITGFNGFVPIKIDLSNTKIEEDSVNNLTAIRYELDEEGNYVPIKLGGNYDAQEKTFTFYTDSFSLYGVVKAKELTKISLGVNKPVYFINGVEGWAEVPPTILNDRTMVPIRLIAEGLGAKVEWLEESRTVNIKSGSKTLSFAIGQLLEGMDTPATIINFRTMVPLRYVSENLGARVLWFADTRNIEIIK